MYILAHLFRSLNVGHSLGLTDNYISNRISNNSPTSKAMRPVSSCVISVSVLLPSNSMKKNKNQVPLKPKRNMPLDKLATTIPSLTDSPRNHLTYFMPFFHHLASNKNKIQPIYTLPICRQTLKRQTWRVFCPNTAR